MSKMKKTRKPGGGRKKLKPEYDAGKNLKEQLDAAVALYNSEMYLQAIGDTLNLNPIKVRKLLITAGVYESDVAEKVQDVLTVQLSIQTTEILQNKVGRKNTPQQKRHTNTKHQKKQEHHKNNKNTPQGVAEKMQLLDHNLKAYNALIKSFKKSSRACIVHPTDRAWEVLHSLPAHCR